MNNKLSTSWEEFKDHLKHGGWKKGAAVASVAVVAPIVLAGCVLETQATEVVVQDKEFASFDQVQAFLGDEYSINQTIKETVEDYAKDTYGQNAKVFSVVSQGKNTLEGNIFAVVENEGKIHVLEIENNADLSMFKGKEYKADTYSFENNTLKFSVDGKEQTVDLAEIPYVYDGETGNLTTFENINSFENALSGAVKSANEIETLSNSMDASQKEIFNLVVSTFASENFKAQFPTINASYNAQTDTTTAEFKFAKETNEITTMTFSFAGDVTNGDGTLNLDKVQVDKDTNYTQNTTTICDEYKEIYSNKDAVINSTEITKENEGEQGGESSVVIDQIQYNDLNEFFTNLSETELDNFKTSLSNAILNNNVISSTTLVRMFGYGTTSKDISLAKIAFVKGDDGYVKLQCIASQTNNNGKITYVTFDLDLTNAIEKDDFGKTLYSGKFTNVEKNGDTITKIAYIDKTGEEQTITAGDGILIHEVEADKSYSVVNFKDCLDLINSTNCVSSTNKVMYAVDVEPTDEQKDLFNLLMPYAVSEKKMFSHITVSYMSSTNPNFPKRDCYTFQLKGYNSQTNHFEHHEIVVPVSDATADKVKDKISGSLLKGEYKSQIKEDKEMISGDIMLEMEENQDVYKITPKVLQIEKE